MADMSGGYLPPSIAEPLRRLLAMVDDAAERRAWTALCASSFAEGHAIGYERGSEDVRVLAVAVVTREAQRMPADDAPPPLIPTFESRTGEANDSSALAQLDGRHQDSPA